MKVRNRSPRGYTHHVAAVTGILSLLLLLAATRPVEAQVTNRSLDIDQTPTVKEWPGAEKRFALVIGVNHYNDKDISPLLYAANDAEILASTLISNAKFPKDQVVVLSSNQREEYQPTRNTILFHLSNVLKRMPKDGLLLIAFAGHGIERNGEPFLLPADARVSDDIELLKLTAINLNEVSNWIRSARIKQVMLFLDACRHDPMAGRSLKANVMSESYRRALNFSERNDQIQAFAILYAASVGQQAWENQGRQQGFFLGAIVDGMKGEAANENGEVTLRQLIQYVEESVPKLAAREGKEQKPFHEVKGYRADDLLIAMGQPNRKGGAELANSSRITIDDKVRDYKFWDSIQNSNDPEDFRAYLRKFPDGDYVDLAKNKLVRLGATAKTQAPATPQTEKEAPIDQVELTYWKSIEDSTNPDAYRAYLNKYPNGQFVTQARARLADLGELTAWNAIRESARVEDFKQYLIIYPHSRFVAQARAKIEELTEQSLWEGIKEGTNPENFRTYLAKYPEGKYAAPARARLGDLVEGAVWQTIKDSRDINALNDYLKQYPGGKYVAQVKARLDEMTELAYWNSISQSEAQENYQAYLNKYPNGKYVAPAQARLREMTELAMWNRVKNSTNPNDLTQYLKAYPNGRFAADANAKLGALSELITWNSIKNSANVSDFNDYLRRYPNGSFIDLARIKVAELTKNQPAPKAPVLTPVTSPPAAEPRPVKEVKAERAAPPKSTPPASVTETAKPNVLPPPETKLSVATSNNEREPGLRLQPYKFEALTLGMYGNVGKRFKGESKSFIESLSGTVTLELAEIPAGVLEMGTGEAELPQVKQEYQRHIGSTEGREVAARWAMRQTPQHTVKIPAFYIGRTEITQAQWREVARLPRVARDLPLDPSQFKGDSLPVENVSWEDAVEFCARLSRASGRTYRLPTEAEWEYACRANSKKVFHFGETITPEWVNYDGGYPYGSGPEGFYHGAPSLLNSNPSAKEGRVTNINSYERTNIYRQKTFPVGSTKITNAFGLSDMHGNVAEWCLDTWHDNYNGAPTDGSAWERGGEPEFKVVRGGGWKSIGAFCLSAFRLKAGGAGKTTKSVFAWCLSVPEPNNLHTNLFSSN